MRLRVGQRARGPKLRAGPARELPSLYLDDAPRSVRHDLQPEMLEESDFALVDRLAVERKEHDAPYPSAVNRLFLIG